MLVASPTNLLASYVLKYSGDKICYSGATHNQVSVYYGKCLQKIKNESKMLKLELSDY